MMKPKTILIVCLVLVVSMTTLELLLRFVYGFGAPVLSMPDSEIDYLFKPNQDCVRFGNKIQYNNKSMRMGFDIKDGCRDSLIRVIVCGDSVVNGGTLTDQKDVATTIVQSLYPTNEVQVLNVSAGSWGPGNLAAYFRKYGSFDATDLIIEVDSHDLWEDDPLESKGRLVGVAPDYPKKNPALATQELLSRYLLPRIRSYFGIADFNLKVDVPRWGSESDKQSQDYNLSCMEFLYSLPIQNKALLIYRSQKESSECAVTYGEKVFRDQASRLNIPVYLLELDASEDYRDIIHPNQSGQRKMALLINEILKNNHALSMESDN